MGCNHTMGAIAAPVADGKTTCTYITLIRQSKGFHRRPARRVRCLTEIYRPRCRCSHLFSLHWGLNAECRAEGCGCPCYEAGDLVRKARIALGEMPTPWREA